MDKYARIRYMIAILCLVMTIVLITFRFASDSNSQVIIYTWSTASDITWSNIINTINTWLNQPLQANQSVDPTSWKDLSDTIAYNNAANSYVQQASSPYLLIDYKYLIPLSTIMYDGERTWVIKLSSLPLIVYYQYQLPNSKFYTYIYDSSANTSRNLDQLTILGKVKWVYIFGIKEPDWYRGVSALINTKLQTLYTGNYAQIQYLWDTLKLNNQDIYLPIPVWWS